LESNVAGDQTDAHDASRHIVFIGFLIEGADSYVEKENSKEKNENVGDESGRPHANAPFVLFGPLVLCQRAV